MSSDNIINREKDEVEETTPEQETNDVTDEEDSEESTEETEGESEVDYKGDLEKLKSKANHDREGYEKRKSDDQSSDHVVADKEAIQQLIEREVEKGINTLGNKVTQQNALMAAKAISASNDEANLVMWHYENSIRKTGDLTEDISNAHLLANKNRLTQERSELIRSAESADLRSKGTGSGVKKMLVEKPTLTPQEKQLAKSMKVSEEALLKAKQG